jgi:pyridoxal phosphate enzyme (YggS family)
MLNNQRLLLLELLSLLGVIDMKSLSEIQAELPPTCRIVAVSKKQPIESILKLYQSGHRDFAENYSQELIEKQYHLRDLKDLRWHFIGSIQKNKLKYLVGNVCLIHSVANLETLNAIDELAKSRGVAQKVLLQLNLAHEPTKNGWTEKNLLDSLDQITSFSSVEISGLMTLPPLHDEAELMRPFFKQLAKLRGVISKVIPTCIELSMGTSGDYLVAASEGATMVRLGTILFGERKAK